MIQIEGHTLFAKPLNPEADGKPFVLLHGITSSVDVWTPDFAAPFLQRGLCYAISLPGHYPAAFPAGFRCEELTADLITHLLSSVIEELFDGQPVMLVGHSTGGFAALAVAAHAPSIVRGVISLAGFARGRWTGLLGQYQNLMHRGWLGETAFKALYRSAQINRATYRRYLLFLSDQDSISTRRSATSGNPRPRILASSPCSADWSATGPESIVLPSAASVTSIPSNQRDQ